MTFLPHFVQNELDAGDDPQDLANFNFCCAYDSILPFADSDTSFSVFEKEHLLGLAVTTTTTKNYVPYPHARGLSGGMILMRGGMH